MHDYFYGVQAEQFTFYRIPKVLFTDERYKNISVDAKTLYGILLDRMNLSAKNGWLDEKGRVLYKNGKPIDLTQVEFQIMELFIRNPSTALVREKILEGVWGKSYYGDVKIVDVNIRRLRMKVEDEPSNPQHILTVWGYGYRWNA